MKYIIAGLGSIGRRHFCNLIALSEKDVEICEGFELTGQRNAEPCF